MATTPYPFVANAILTASQLNSTFNIPVSTKTVSYTLVASDAGTRVVMNSSSATTITVNTSLFAAGDNLEITNIGVGVCTVTAGTATVSTSGTLALVANAGGTLYFTSAGVSVFIASGVAASSGTKIGQVVSTTLTTTFTTSSTSFTDITGLSVAITPTLNTSKILVMVQLSASQDVGSNQAAARLVRGSTAIDVGDAAGSRTQALNQVRGQATDTPIMIPAIFLDSPATTSATTYKMQGIVYTSGTFYVNRSSADTNSPETPRTASTITVMEVLV